MFSYSENKLISQLQAAQNISEVLEISTLSQAQYNGTRTSLLNSDNTVYNLVTNITTQLEGPGGSNPKNFIVQNQTLSQISLDLKDVFLVNGDRCNKRSTSSVLPFPTELVQRFSTQSNNLQNIQRCQTNRGMCEFLGN